MRNYEDLEVWQKAHALTGNRQMLTALLQNLRRTRKTFDSGSTPANSERRKANSGVAL
jgi:hypothetical protein